MDHRASNVTGRVTASRARVIRRGGRLYVFTAPTGRKAPGRREILADPQHVHVFDAPDRPTQNGSTLSVAGVTWEQHKGCGCNFPTALKRDAEQVWVNRAEAMIADGRLAVVGPEGAVVG